MALHDHMPVCTMRQAKRPDLDISSHPIEIEDEEVEWVVRTTKERCQENIEYQESGVCVDANNLQLQPSELKTALELWLCYMLNKQTLTDVMSAYGKHEDGKMDADDIKRMLELLSAVSGGEIVEDGTAAQMMRLAKTSPNSQGIGGPELIKLLGAWCVRQERRRRAAAASAAPREQGRLASLAPPPRAFCRPESHACRVS